MGKIYNPGNRHWVHRDPRHSIDAPRAGVTGNDVVPCITLGAICQALEAGHPFPFPLWYLERRFVRAYAGLALHDNHRYFFSSRETVPEPTGLDNEPLYSLYWLREYFKARPQAKQHLDNPVLAQLEEKFKALEERPPDKLLTP